MDRLSRQRGDLGDGVGQAAASAGIKSLRLMTNNPRKVKALSSYGIDIAERVPLHVGRNPHNEHYLDTKQSKLGHWLETHQDDDPEV